MARTPHRTRPGEFEVRIMPDGRVVFVAADETLMDAMSALDPGNAQFRLRRKAKSRGEHR